MFIRLFEYIDIAIQQNMAVQIGLVINAVSPLMGAAVALYAIYLVFTTFFNTPNLAFKEGVTFIVSLSVVAIFASHSGWYFINVVPFVTGAGDDLVHKMLLSTSSEGGATLQAMFDTILRDLELLYSSMNFKYNSSDSWIATAYIFIQMVLIVLGGGLFLLVATAYLLIAKIFVSFLVVLGPIFIMFAFFPATRSFFQQWTGQIFNYFLLSVVFPLAFGVFHQALLATVYDTNITFASILMLFIVYVALVIMSTQIPVFCAALSGGIGISGIAGSLVSVGKMASGVTKSAAKGTGKGVYGLGKGATNLGKGAYNYGKGKIKAG